MGTFRRITRRVAGTMTLMVLGLAVLVTSAPAADAQGDAAGRRQGGHDDARPRERHRLPELDRGRADVQRPLQLRQGRPDVPGSGGGPATHQPGRPDLHDHAPQGRPLPPRPGGRRRGRQVQLRAHAHPGHEVLGSAVPRRHRRRQGDAGRRGHRAPRAQGHRSAHCADPAEGAPGRVPVEPGALDGLHPAPRRRPRPRERRSARSRSARGPTGSSSGCRASASSWSAIRTTS